MNRILITGGAGFIGSNLANALLEEGYHVRILDSLVRLGTRFNLNWLRGKWDASRLEIVEGDVRDFSTVSEAIDGVDAIFHLAAQVAVTKSVSNPRRDFEVNALGTLNVLEAARMSKPKPFVAYTSTNKVYGKLEKVAIDEEKKRYVYRDHPRGIAETQPLDFLSPYGCSKGAADQYVSDYARIYDVPTTVFRMSCIYGTRQFGTEDQGWVAHFAISALKHRPITIYGDGRQVRDLLWIDDLIDAFLAALHKSDEVAGHIFNIGGGAQNTISVWQEFGPVLNKLIGYPIPVTYGPWRSGDQKVYISDIGKAQRLLDWKPEVGIQVGVPRMLNWLRENRDLVDQASGA